MDWNTAKYYTYISTAEKHYAFVLRGLEVDDCSLVENFDILKTFTEVNVFIANPNTNLD